MSTAREVVTFWKATSGHRPESAEVARRIEGFDDDFKYVEQEEEEEEEQQQEEEEDTGPNYRELIEVGQRKLRTVLRLTLAAGIHSIVLLQDQVAVERELRAKNSNLQKKVGQRDGVPLPPRTRRDSNSLWRVVAGPHDL